MDSFVNLVTAQAPHILEAIGAASVVFHLIPGAVGADGILVLGWVKALINAIALNPSKDKAAS